MAAVIHSAHMLALHSDGAHLRRERYLTAGIFNLFLFPAPAL